MSARILVVCTANRCRSPLAAAILSRELERRGLDAEVSSAGLLPGGEPVPAPGLRVAREHGLDLTAHRSTQLDPALIDTADLVLGMAREHARAIAADRPDLLDRTFTLVGFRHWLERTSGVQTAAALVGTGPDDVTDPLGRSLRVWRQVADRLDDETARIAATFGPVLTSG